MEASTSTKMVVRNNQTHNYNKIKMQIDRIKAKLENDLVAEDALTSIIGQFSTKLIKR